MSLNQGPELLPTDVQMQLVHLVAVEVFEAALDAAAQEDPDIKKRDLQGALPPIREDTWQEVSYQRCTCL